MSMISDFQELMKTADDRPAEVRTQREAAANAAQTEARLISNYHRAQIMLAAELIGKIHAQQPEFFEHLVIDVLLAMGYGSRRRDLTHHLGQTGDGGIDGVISQDELGLDLIYVQAKRLKPGSVVPVSEVRDFVGSLDARHASKGIFFTTSHFSPASLELCQHVTRRVVLVDGNRLGELMIRHNIGVKVKESFQLKRIDADYFAPSSAVRMRAMISASSQPRR